MKALALSFLAVTALYPVRSMSQSPDLSRLPGQWSGPATFFDAELARRIGPLPFTATFSADRTGTGRIGEGAFKVVRMSTAGDRIEIRTTLTGKAASDPALAKTHMVLVITMLTDSTMQGEFHLKSNSVYDPRMREGRLTLVRARSDP